MYVRQIISRLAGTRDLHVLRLKKYEPECEKTIHVLPDVRETRFCREFSRARENVLFGD